MSKRLEQNTRRLGKHMTVGDKSHCSLMVLLDLATPDVADELERLLKVVEMLAERNHTLALRLDKEIAYIHVKKPMHNKQDVRDVDIEPQTLLIG